LQEEVIMLLVTDAPKQTFITRVFRKIEDISREEWNRVFPDVLEGYDFLKTIAQSGFDQFSFYYIMVYHEDVPVSVVPCFLMVYPFSTTVQGKLKAIFEFLEKFFPRFFNLKVLISGSPVCQSRIRIQADDKAAVTKAILDSLEKIAKKESAPVIAFKDISEGQYPEFKRLLNQGFFKIQTFPSVVMDISFASFEEYLKGLSQSTRYDLKRKFKKVQTLSKIEFRVSNHLEGLWDEAYELYQQTFLKSDIHFEKAPKDFFKNLTYNMPDRVKYFQWYIHDKLAAFECCLISNDTLIAEYIGLDYRVAHEYHLYFVRFRDLLNWCLQNKIKKWDAGMMSYEPKKRLGFKAGLFFAYVRHRNRLLHPLFEKVCRFLNPSNFDKALKGIQQENFLDHSAYRDQDNPGND